MAHGLLRFSVLLSTLAIADALSAPPYAFPNCTTGPLKDIAVCDVTKDPITRATSLIDLWTDVELTNNSVHSSPGVPRLGIPPYNWRSEALVSLSHLVDVVTAN